MATTFNVRCTLTGALFPGTVSSLACLPVQCSSSSTEHVHGQTPRVKDSRCTLPQTKEANPHHHHYHRNTDCGLWWSTGHSTAKLVGEGPCLAQLSHPSNHATVQFSYNQTSVRVFLFCFSTTFYTRSSNEQTIVRCCCLAIVLHKVNSIWEPGLTDRMAEPAIRLHYKNNNKLYSTQLLCN